MCFIRADVQQDDTKALTEFLMNAIKCIITILSIESYQQANPSSHSDIFETQLASYICNYAGNHDRLKRIMLCAFFILL